MNRAPASGEDGIWHSVIESVPVPLARLEPVRGEGGTIMDFVFRYVNPRGVESPWPSGDEPTDRRLLADIGVGDEQAAALTDGLRGVVRSGRRWSARGFRLPGRTEETGSGDVRFDVFASKLDDGVVLIWCEKTPVPMLRREPERIRSTTRARRDVEDGEVRRQEWLATLRHELANSVNTMLGYCDLLRAEISGTLNERQKGELGRIRRACAHLTSLVDDSLASFRRGAGASPVRHEEVDVLETVGDVVGLMQPEAERRGLGLRLRCPERGPVLQTDGGKLRQILINLLGNALKYTEDGEVEVEVDASDQEWVCFRVRDTGPGIPEERRDQIFEPYVRLGSEEDEERSGSGLGLAVCRDLARRLGGEVSLEGASPSEGSIFSVRLPRRGIDSESSFESDTA